MNLSRMTCFSVALAAALFASGASSQAGIINGGFETGDLTGWSGSAGFSAAATASANGIPAHVAYEGSYFGMVQSGLGEHVYSMLSQVFSANAGDVLTFYAYFGTSDYQPFNDDGYVDLIDITDNVRTNLFAASVITVGSTQGNPKSTPWTFGSFSSFITGHQYRIEAGVENVGDNGVASEIGLDAVFLREANPNAVPEPMSLAIWGVGGVALLIGAARRRREQASA